MCIILTCEAGVRPSNELIDDCFFMNPDGGGLMWVEDGFVQVSKGYATPGELMEAIKLIPINSQLVIHMRIATSGGISEQTCHPFPITDDLERLHETDLACSAAVAHNGIIFGMRTNVDEGVSDTISFIQDILSQSFRGRVSRRLRRKINAVAPDNRFAIMTSDGNVSRIGDGWETVTYGIQASNDSWRPFDDVYNWKLDNWKPNSCGTASHYDELGSCDDYDYPENALMKKVIRNLAKCSGCKYIDDCMDLGPTCTPVQEVAYEIIEMAYTAVS